MPTLITAMAAGIAALDAAVIIGALALTRPAARERVREFVHSYGLLCIIVLTVLSVAGSLLMEHQGGLLPCLMCWWQRVFLYPVPLIALVAFAKNLRLSDITDYVLALSIPGALVALYQHLLQILPSGTLIPCDASGECAVRQVFEFGFVTIPWMALSVFAALIFISLVGSRR